MHAGGALTSKRETWSPRRIRPGPISIRWERAQCVELGWLYLEIRRSTRIGKQSMQSAVSANACGNEQDLTQII